MRTNLRIADLFDNVSERLRWEWSRCIKTASESEGKQLNVDSVGRDLGSFETT